MKVVFDSVSPPAGPSSAPTTVSRSQAMAFGATKAESVEELPGFTWPQTVLLSRECRQVARTCALAFTSPTTLLPSAASQVILPALLRIVPSLSLVAAVALGGVAPLGTRHPATAAATGLDVAKL